MPYQRADNKSTQWERLHTRGNQLISLCSIQQGKKYSRASDTKHLTVPCQGDALCSFKTVFQVSRAQISPPRMGRLPLIDWGLAVFSRGGSSFPLGLWFNLHSFEAQAGRTRNLVQNRTTLTAVIVVDRVHPQQPTGKSTPFPICATHGSGIKHQKPRRKSSRIQSHRCLKTGARGLDVNSRRTNSGTGAGPAWVNWRGAQGGLSGSWRPRELARNNRPQQKA